MSTHFSSILLAFDGSENSYKALEAAEELAKLSEGSLTVAYVSEHLPTYERPVLSSVTVLNQPFTFAGPVPAPKDDIVSEMEPHDDPTDQILSEAKLHLSNTLRKVDFVKLTGHPEQELCQFAEQNQVDVIVIGNRGFSGLKKLVMGSVSDQVTNRAECQVLVVK